MEKRGKSSRLIILIFFIPFFIWILLQFIAPLAIPYSTLDDLTGNTVVSDNDIIIDKLPVPWNSIYSCGDSLCHQKAERSFFINENQMPFCVRCTAIWMGFAIGLGIMIFLKINLDQKFFYLIIIGLLPIGVDGLGQLLGLWESLNIIRLITGLLIGIICGIAIAIIIDELVDIFPFKKTQSN
jgi:uncharacterized membrane protein